MFNFWVHKNKSLAKVAQEWRQGDVFQIYWLTYRDSLNRKRKRASPLGVALISQTCDIVQGGSNELSTCPVVTLDGNEKNFAEKGKNARYIPLPLIGDNYFADLALISSVSITALHRCKRTIGVGTGVSDEVTRFGHRVGRRFSRYPFPDEIVPWLSGLRAIVFDKTNNPKSHQGLAMNKVLELRIEAGPPNFWTNPPYRIILLVILKEGELPNLAEPTPPSATLAQFLSPSSGIKPSAEEIAKRLTGSQLNTSLVPPDPKDRQHLWIALAERWAELVKLKNPSNNSAKIKEALFDGKISVELLPEDEITYSRIRNSQMLDLQHLSRPYPIAE